MTAKEGPVTRPTDASVEGFGYTKASTGLRLAEPVLSDNDAATASLAEVRRSPARP